MARTRNNQRTGARILRDRILLSAPGPGSGDATAQRSVTRGNEASDHFAVRRMVDPVVGRHIRDVEGIDPLQATDVVAVQPRVGTPLVMRVDAADGTEVMSGRVRIERVDPELPGTFDNVEPGERHGSHDGAPSPAIRTIATPRADHALRQIQQQFHRAAMAGSSMPCAYERIAHCLETHPQAPSPMVSVRHSRASGNPLPTDCQRPHGFPLLRE